MKPVIIIKNNPNLASILGVILETKFHTLLFFYSAFSESETKNYLHLNYWTSTHFSCLTFPTHIWCCSQAIHAIPNHWDILHISGKVCYHRKVNNSHNIIKEYFKVSKATVSNETFESKFGQDSRSRKNGLKSQEQKIFCRYWISCSKQVTEYWKI